MMVENRSRSHVSNLQKENDRLRRAVAELSVLNQLATEIGSSLESRKILEKIVNTSIRAVDSEQGVLALVDPKGEKPSQTLVRVMYSSSTEQRYELREAVVGWMQRNRRPLLVNSPKTDKRFRREKWDERLSSLLSVPLMVKSKLTGILIAYNKKKGKFTEDDQRLLAILASQSAQVIENARLYEEEKELIKMQVEWKAAARIQEQLLPRSPPEISGYEIAGKSIAARNVGGDFFDFLQVDENQWAICLGDVSGKGLPAALLMANLLATIREQMIRRIPMQECLVRSDRSLFRSSDPERYATAFFGILDNKRETFRFSNCGHNSPFLFSSEKVRLLNTGGPPIGLLEGCLFEEEELPFRSGDLLAIYSDGAVDATNESEEPFGVERLRKTVEDNLKLPADMIVERILQSILSYSGTSAQMDDITLVIVKNRAE